MQQERLLSCVRDLHVAARRLAARDESRNRIRMTTPVLDDAPVHIDHRARIEILGAILLTMFLRRSTRRSSERPCR